MCDYLNDFTADTYQEELQSRLQHVQDLMRELQTGTAEVRGIATDMR